MNSPQTIASLALRLLMISQLQKTIENEQDLLEKTNFSTQDEKRHSSQGTNLENQLFHLSRSKDITSIGYGSAIAFKLGTLQNRPPTEIAAQIATHLVTPTKNSLNILQPPSLDRVWQQVGVRSTPQGWLQFSVSEAGLAEWMQCLIDFSFHQNPSLSADPFSFTKSNFKDYNQLLRKSTNLFIIQHTHSRCCSLLRSCDREGLIHLTLHPSDLALWHIKAPSPLPWLTDAGTLRVSHQAEQRLIAQLVTVLDEISAPDGNSEDPSLEQVIQHRLKRAEALSHAFLSFHAACRLLGEVKAIDRPLAQTRAGLVLATQSVLKFLLEVELGVVAPSEL